MSAGDPLKVVVRLLPPEITEEEFRKTVSEQKWASVKWSTFQSGKRYKENGPKPSVNSRCYLLFDAIAQAEEFISEYHGRQFIDGQGETFRAVACFCPYQKAPRKTQADAREGTVEDDPIFQEFAASLLEKKEYDPPADPKAGMRPAKPGETPLLMYMQQRALDRKAKWEKRKGKKDWYAMDTVEEYPKRAKWRCGECGTAKYLEEDPDNRGTFYCTYCWESYEAQAAAEAPKSKKKKKKAKDEVAEEEEEEVEESSSKKKKKKKKEKEAAEKSEWRAKDGASESWSEYAYEEEPSDSKSRRKKKKEKADAAYEDTSWKEAEWGAQEWSEPKSSRNKSKKESKETEWWEEPQEKAGRSSGKKPQEEQWGKDDAWWEDARGGEASPGKGGKGDAKWKAKADDEGAAKSRRGKKDKGGEGDAEYWASTKSSSGSYYR